MGGTPVEVQKASTSLVDALAMKMSYQDEVLHQCDLGSITKGKPGGHNHFEIECQANKWILKFWAAGGAEVFS